MLGIVEPILDPVAVFVGRLVESLTTHAQQHGDPFVVACVDVPDSAVISHIINMYGTFLVGSLWLVRDGDIELNGLIVERLHFHEIELLEL